MLDDQNELNHALQALRSAIGSHPRILRIEVTPNILTIVAQDPNNHKHVNQWRCSVARLGFIPIPSVTGPVPFEVSLINPDLEGNLFDLDSIAFPATEKLEKVATEKGYLEDAARIEHMEIARQTYLLPKPGWGDVRWTLHFTEGQYTAEVYANAQGNITGSNITVPERAEELHLFKQPEVVAYAAAAFANVAGTDPVLTSVTIDDAYVSFDTNIPDNRFRKSDGVTVDLAEYLWNLNGLWQSLPHVEIKPPIEPAKTSFSVNDVDWTMLAKIKADALAKTGRSAAQISRIQLSISSSKPGAAVLTWSFTIKDSNGAETSVTADARR